MRFYCFFWKLLSLPFICLSSRTFSCLMSSFFTDLRLDLRSMEPLFLDPKRALIISSADTLTFLRAGFLNFPPRSCTFRFNWCIYKDVEMLSWWLVVVFSFFFSCKSIVSWRLTYISVVLEDFGLTVVPFLIHHLDLFMDLPTEFLQNTNNTIAFKYKNKTVLCVTLYVLWQIFLPAGHPRSDQLTAAVEASPPGIEPLLPLLPPFLPPALL